jgi:ABC-2 type transport system permease protein
MRARSHWRSIRTIARKEAIEMIRDSRFRWASTVVLLLLAAAAVSGWHQYTEMRQLHERAQREERDRWLNKGEMNGHPAMHFGVFVYKPYLPLSAIDDGIAPYVGSYSLLEAHEQRLFQDKPAEDQVPSRRISEMTAAVCLQVLVPLVIILAGFATFIGERERGTWQQTLSMGVRVVDLCIGKGLGAATPVLIFAIPAAVLGSIAILRHSGVIFTDTTIRLAILSTTYVVYFLIFFGSTLAVSMISRSSRQALLILLIFWFGNSLMIPRLAIDLARAIHPDPTSFQVAAEIIKDRLSSHIKTMPEIERELLAQYHAESLVQVPVNPEGIYLLDEQRVNDRIYNHALDWVYATYLDQDRVTQMAGAVAPILAMQSVSMGLAGTDVSTHRHFAEYARVYRTNMETILNEDTAYNLPPGPRGIELWSKIPPFQYTPPRLPDVLNTCAIGLGLLLAWLVVVAVLLSRAALRVIR